MLLARGIVTVLTLAAVLQAAAAQTPAAASAPATAPAAQAASMAATNPNDVPVSVFVEMQAAAKQPDPNATQEQALAQFTKSMEAIVAIGEKAEKDYPKASNLHDLQIRILWATGNLYRATRDAKYNKAIVEIAKRGMAANPPVDAAVQFDFLILRDSLVESNAPAEEMAPKVRQFVAKYDKAPTAAPANYFGTLLAVETRQEKLATEYIETLEAKYSDEPGIRSFLQQMGRHPEVGKPFNAVFAKPDGTKLTLPADLLGKIVVVDFWSTLCPPWIEGVATLKKTYEKYKDKGVVFVGVNEDANAADAKKFIADNQITWLQTADNEKHEAAMKLGLRGLPSQWIVGANGNVITSQAFGRLDEMLDEAVNGPTTRSASQPATAADPKTPAPAAAEKK